MQAVTVQLSIMDDADKEVFHYKAELTDNAVVDSEIEYKKKVQDIVDFVLFMMTDFKDTSSQTPPVMSKFNLAGSLVS